MNIIFLDVDGVLNDFYTLKKRGKRNIFEEPELDLDEDKIKLLKELIDKTNAKIVLSSSWRVFFDKDTLNPKNNHGQELRRLLYKYGLEIYSLTKRSGNGKREDEINDWLENHDDIESFVILDDEDSHLPGFVGENLVKTEYYSENSEECGLTPNHVEEAVRIMNQKRIVKQI